ncbi:hypothetical protein GobsT_50440 [Gemmata obscuriglobus]|nr:hypothetical protein GobsT_50440 [Gemmata obscuriglobus]VTS09565.1 unnamed protein product [Gemmata obscuriglobus UQM 2246]
MAHSLLYHSHPKHTEGSRMQAPITVDHDDLTRLTDDGCPHCDDNV